MAKMNEIQAECLETIASLMEHNSRVLEQIRLRYSNEPTRDEFEQMERLGIQCYSNVVLSLQEAEFWMKRLANGLENDKSE